MNGPVQHFELPAEDVERASAFYRDAFGWNVNTIAEMNYTILATGPTDDEGRPTETGTINGGMFKREGDFASVSGPIVTLVVDDLDAALERVKELGGGTVMEKMKVGEMGFAAYFSDTEGNTMGLWQES